jgi:hypothetical protein
MKVLRLRRLTLLGVGFLLGSRAGRGPWNKTVDAWNQVQDKAGSRLPTGQVKEKIEQAKGKLSHSSKGDGYGGGGDLSTTAKPMSES